NAGRRQSESPTHWPPSPAANAFRWPEPDCPSNPRNRQRSNRMAVERTLSIIKPDGVAKNVIGEIYNRFEKAGLKIVAARMMQLSREDAEGFYAVHRERPFFNDLVSFMISGPVVVQVLEGEDAIR